MALFPDAVSDPVVVTWLAATRLRPCIEAAARCFALESRLSEIAVCGEVYGRNGEAPAMPVPHLAWLARRESRFDFAAAIASCDQFAAAAMRFQTAAIPSHSENILAIILSDAEAPFVTSILHFARSGQVRLAPGTLTTQRLRFVRMKERHKKPDFSGIRPVFLETPSRHQVLSSAGIAADFQAFQG